MNPANQNDEAAKPAVGDIDSASGELLSCPFCEELPTVGPINPRIEGNAFGYVRCFNPDCPAQPMVKDGENVSDERGSKAYQQIAIQRWNAGRESVSALAAELEKLRTCVKHCGTLLRASRYALKKPDKDHAGFLDSAAKMVAIIETHWPDSSPPAATAAKTEEDSVSETPKPQSDHPHEETGLLPCPECDGTGAVDSGGVTPWGAGIDVMCYYCGGTGRVTPTQIPSSNDSSQASSVAAGGTVCPKCGSDHISDLGPKQILFKRYKCLDCGSLHEHLAKPPKLAPSSAAAKTIARDDWRKLYQRMYNIAAGLTNHCEEGANLRRYERELEATEKDARALSAQSQPAAQWIKTSEQSPTEKDAEKHGWVLSKRVDNDYPDTYAWRLVRDFPTTYLFWMPIPPLSVQQEVICQK